MLEPDYNRGEDKTFRLVMQEFRLLMLKPEALEWKEKPVKKKPAKKEMHQRDTREHRNPYKPAETPGAMGQ
jgi:hypothetical protein